ncbi:MAG: BON domain-containing protein [Burkholderiales bacterium]|nr:BON domain-containing protein [Burkholderiales bacterium]
MQCKQLVTVTALSAALGCTLLATACTSTPTRESTGEVIDDAWITTRVKAAFVEDKAVSALNIAVETFKGTVQLSGFANSNDERMRAAELARNIKGVKVVRNDIRLKTAG